MCTVVNMFIHSKTITHFDFVDQDEKNIKIFIGIDFKYFYINWDKKNILTI